MVHVVLTAFYNRREEEELASNVELFEILILTKQANRRAGLSVGRFKSKIRALAERTGLMKIR